jgi:hypothetical protein
MLLRIECGVQQLHNVADLGAHLAGCEEIHEFEGQRCQSQSRKEMLRVVKVRERQKVVWIVVFFFQAARTQKLANKTAGARSPVVRVSNGGVLQWVLSRAWQVMHTAIFTYPCISHYGAIEK